MLVYLPVAHQPQQQGVLAQQLIRPHARQVEKPAQANLVGGNALAAGKGAGVFQRGAQGIGFVKSMGENRVKGYVPVCGYLYEQNITDFYNNSATNMDDAVLYIEKGIKTPVPANTMGICGKDMKLQASN